ncbi:unnamed protein product [Caenorhabditis bovis]|uniref:Uncharacterized protein n=1 Tax=Caenorhabditis bovis TaxID=2654633 RepID=A0A8S1EGH1_9PELO|nr:unnamed protein product [Caenorhabditis bovis]
MSDNNFSFDDGSVVDDCLFFDGSLSADDSLSMTSTVRRFHREDPATPNYQARIEIFEEFELIGVCKLFRSFKCTRHQDHYVNHVFILQQIANEKRVCRFFCKACYDTPAQDFRRFPVKMARLMHKLYPFDTRYKSDLFQEIWKDCTMNSRFKMPLFRWEQHKFDAEGASEAEVAPFHRNIAAYTQIEKIYKFIECYSFVAAVPTPNSDMKMKCDSHSEEVEAVIVLKENVVNGIGERDRMVAYPFCFLCLHTKAYSVDWPDSFCEVIAKHFPFKNGVPQEFFNLFDSYTDELERKGMVYPDSDETINTGEDNFDVDPPGFDDPNAFCDLTFLRKFKP